MVGHGTSPDDLSVVISASIRIDLNMGNEDGTLSPRLFHAVNVTQSTQSWTVVRDHADFTVVGSVLSSIIGSLPNCPQGPNFVVGQSGNDVDKIVGARNEAQNWLINILLYPGARESPTVRQFLCYDANIIPPQLEGVNWIHFASSGYEEDHQSRVETKSKEPEADSVSNGIDDELDMSYMFGYQEDISNSEEHEHEDYNYDQYDNFSAAERYQPTVDQVTHDDLTEFQNSVDDVEMVEDVGSLAQSLGASHLGRSLQLQAEIANIKETSVTNQDHGVKQGLKIEEPTTPMVSGGRGGIGNAVLNAPSQQSRLTGLSDSFHQQKPISAPRLDSFKMIKVIGKGSFGKVFLVREIKTDDMFALKVLRKDNIIKRNQVEHTRTERNVLGHVNHPFIVGLRMAFQSKDKLYFVLDYCPGGELFFHLSKVGKFPEPRAAFYAAEIVLALSYIHAMDIIYRDLKPENVLLDAKGHVRLTDFGLSKEGISLSSSGATSFCGTPEYLAPEILNRQGHGRAVDWWSLGALLYEMLTGLPPFYDRDREKLFENIRKGHLDFRSLTPRAQALLKGLLTKDPLKRLGSDEKDAKSIQSHEFFHDIEWEKLMKGEIHLPWCTPIHGSTDTSQFDERFTKMPIQSPPIKQHVFGTTPQENLFEGFTFTDQRFYAPT